MFNNQKVVEEQEDPKAEQYRDHFRRLYDNAEGEQKFNLSDEGRYLVHAILQMGLYSMKQECCISFVTQKDCINDGTNAFPMSKEYFLQWMENRKNNPGTQQPIKPETFYFYNCHIKAGQFNDSNLHARFFNNEFESYKTAYDKAIGILLGLIGLIDVDQSLPEEIKNVVSAIKPEAIIRTLVENAQSAEEIKKLLEKIADNTKNERLGKIIQGILCNALFKGQYENAQEGFLTKFKNFVIKCFIVIYEVAKWLFTVDRNSKHIDNWRENCKAWTKNSANEDFKSFVKENLSQQNLSGVQSL